MRESVIDYAISSLLERVKSLPPSNADKIDEVCPPNPLKLTFRQLVCQKTCT
jgi:hypothetical protein